MNTFNTIRHRSEYRPEFLPVPIRLDLERTGLPLPSARSAPAELQAWTLPAFVLQKQRSDAVHHAEGRYTQTLIATSRVRSRLDDFLGVDLSVTPDGKPTSAYYSYEQMPANLRGLNLLGAAGITRGDDQPAYAFALADLPGLSRNAAILGVNEQRFTEAAIGQELVHAAVYAHPKFAGRFNTAQNEVLGEAFSLSYAGRDYLSTHLSIVAASERLARQSASAGYSAFMPISNPAIAETLREYGFGNGSDDSVARSFLARFEAHLNARVASYTPDQTSTDVVVDFARRQLGVADPQAFAETLSDNLTKAYGEASERLFDELVPEDSVPSRLLSSPWDYRPSL